MTPRTSQRARLAALLVAGAASLTGALLARRRMARWFEDDVTRRLPRGADGIVVGGGPIALDASATHAVLVLHGFNDTSRSMAPLAHALHARGWTVRAPLLPGHGRALPEAARTRAEEWVTFAREQYEALAATHERVVVCGQSMGGALAVLIAAKHPGMRALALLAPYLRMPHQLQLQLVLAWIAQLVVPYRRSVGGERSIHDPIARRESQGLGVVTAGMITQLRRVAAKAARDLPRVTVPTLYLQSVEDNRISAADAREHFAHLGAEQKQQRWITGCGHILSADYARDEVADAVHDWFVRYAGDPLGDVGGGDRERDP